MVLTCWGLRATSFHNLRSAPSWRQMPPHRDQQGAHTQKVFRSKKQGNFDSTFQSCSVLTCLLAFSSPLPRAALSLVSLKISSCNLVFSCSRPCNFASACLSSFLRLAVSFVLSLFMSLMFFPALWHSASFLVWEFRSKSFAVHDSRTQHGNGINTKTTATHLQLGLEFLQCLHLHSLRTLLHIFFLQHEKTLPSTE